MPTPIFVCGGECAVNGTGPSAVTTRHWSQLSGTVQFVTSGPSPMRSERCIRLLGGAGATIAVHTFTTPIASPATIVARFAVYFATLPSTDLDLFSGSSLTSGIKFLTASSTIRPHTAVAGYAVTTGVWYVVDVKIVRDTTATVDWRVNGVDQEQYSFSSAAGVQNGFQLGDNAHLYTGELFFDDICVSGTSGDYPIGDGTVVGLYPSADSAHSYDEDTDWDYEDGSAVPLAATDTWQHLQNPLSFTIGVHLRAIASDATEYLQWAMEDMPADVASVNGLAVVSQHHAASTSTCRQTIYLNDGGSLITIQSAVDFSETTIISAYLARALAADSNPWTKAKVDALLVRWLCTDVNPDAYLDGVMLEVDYVASAAPGPTFPRSGRAGRRSARLLLNGGF